MSKKFTVTNVHSPSPGVKSEGRIYHLTMAGIPKVDAKTKARLEAAARDANRKKRDFPTLSVKS
ncbi:hypothetical protein [Variovorax sp. HJSM1_2]|uniref:hypothetical protein n=1 Tax=Variovorax sp. HJSM1_2 TaxID=3366263 RepID=UPI003BDDD86A